MVGQGGDVEDGARSASLLVTPTKPLRAATPEGLTRITRVGHALLDAPVQVVATSVTTAEVLASTPHEVDPAPLQVTRRLSTAGNAMTVTAADGSTWVGAAAGRWGRGLHVCLCTTAVQDGGHTRAALNDLAALATDVLGLDTARVEADGLRELLGTASHDLRNPLSVLRAGLDTLTLHGDELPDGQAERIADLAVRQARRMSGMIDGMLSLNDLDGDSERERIDLRTLARDAVEAGRLSHELVELRVDGDLPDEPVVVRGRPGSLERVLTNLVSNAAVHGGGRVWVGLDVHGAEATLSVSDDGPGMPGDSALDTGQRASRSGGHGLGLVIAQRIVAAHEGSIGYRDRDGGGTVVQITLPLARR